MWDLAGQGFLTCNSKQSEAFGGFQTGSGIGLEETRGEIELVARSDFRTISTLDCKLYAKRYLGFAAFTQILFPFL